MTERYAFDTIFTLEARSNVLLESIAERLRLGSSEIFNWIKKDFAHLKAILESKGIHYLDLRRALTPNTDRVEGAFVFDWTLFDHPNYGREIHELALPHLPRQSSRSVLVGDWTSHYSYAEIHDGSYATPTNSVGKRASDRGNTLTFFYLNNLTVASVARITAALSGHRAYAGFLDLTYMTPMKGFLSTMLIRLYVQHRSIILQGHEDDRSDEENVNLVGYDFGAFGYAVKSVPSSLYGLFLSYKIESPPYPGDRTDTQFSSNAMSSLLVPIDECEMEIDEEKLEYLRRNKDGTLHRTGLKPLSAEDVAEQIKAKLQSNYIFSLARDEGSGTMKFSIVIEFGRQRALCAMEYLVRPVSCRHLIRCF